MLEPNPATSQLCSGAITVVFAHADFSQWKPAYSLRWPTQLLRVTDNAFTPERLTALAARVWELRNSDQGVRKSNKGGWQSKVSKGSIACAWVRMCVCTWMWWSGHYA